MRRVIAAAILAPLVLTTWAPAAQAGRSTDIALGLASFAVFNQVVRPLLKPRHAEAAYHRSEVVYTTVPPPVVYYTPAVVHAAPRVVVTPTVIQYPHGRYELQVHGHQYVWVWIPTTPPPPPPPPPAAAPPAPPAP
jgi:hypothetical protein